MKVITQKDALLHCFDLWLWLAVTGGRAKNEWPGWKSSSGYLEYCLNFCPVCEYVKGSCEKCIINWKYKSCDALRSEYYVWYYATTKEARSKAALEIAILAANLL